MQPRLKYFKPHEFAIRCGNEVIEWWDRIDPHLLILLDRFRGNLAPLSPHSGGVKVRISPACGSVGRHQGKDGTSQHNIDRWGVVKAVDVMPDLGLQYRRNAVGIAISTGFTGIGVYPDWQPHWGLHLDVRDDREPGDPATWSGVDIWDHEKRRMVQVYRPLEVGLGA